jgi:hypothetical protein
MSTIEVNTIDSVSGTSTLTLGSSNAGTIALGSGDVQSNFLYPAFHAYLSSAQSLSEETTTKINFNTEEFDTNSCYDNSTNYRFTPTLAGKYYVYSQIYWVQGSTTNLKNTAIRIYKNGSQHRRNFQLFTGSYVQYFTSQISSIVDMNGSSDYLEIFGSYDTNNNGGCQAYNGADVTYFGAYRIGT